MKKLLIKSKSVEEENNHSEDKIDIKTITSMFYEDEEEQEVRKKLHIEYETLFSKENIIKLFTIIIMANCALVLVRYFSALQSLRPKIVSNNPIYILFSAIAPFILWIISTDEIYWQFHNRKLALFYIAIVNAILTLTQPLYSLYWKIAVSTLFQLETNKAFTEGMVIMDAQILIFVLEALTIYIIWHNVSTYFLNDVFIAKIKRFKLAHHIDTRTGKEFLYDLKITKNLETAQDIVIKQADRLIHMLINGASGTGKTSSVILPAIANDMDIKTKNKQLRQDELIKMLIAKPAEAYYAWPTVEFDEYRVVPYEKYKKKYNKIYKKYPDCGMTIMAPNNSIIDDVIKLAEARNLVVNVLDPAAVYNNPYVREMGINPFYIPLGLSERERVIRINDAATIFSEVLIAVNEGSKEPDQYFSDISKSVTSNIAQVCMLARNIEGRQTDIKEIQKCISDFNKLNSYIKTIENHYKMTVPTNVMKDKEKGDNLDYLKQMAGDKNKQAKSTNGENNPYYESIYFVKNELLGAGKDKMYDQARGLRNLMSKILNDPRFKEILSSDAGSRIDFDQLLAENQIVCINTALELGSERSTTFGLFYLLTQKASILRRPKDKRSLHFIWVDELSQYVHPSLEDMITLYRQYGAAVTFALQSRAQMHKNSMTKYLDDVFDGVGTHIAFGRLSPEDMKKYQEMAGKSKQDTVQKTVSGNSVLSEDPNESWSERTTTTYENNIEGSEMRYMDFQEITIMTTDNGRPINAMFGKVFFLKPSDFKKRVEKKLKWNVLQENITIGSTEETTLEEQPTQEKKVISKHIGINTELIEPTITMKYIDTDENKAINNNHWEELNKPEGLSVSKKVIENRKAGIIKSKEDTEVESNKVNEPGDKKFKTQSPIQRLDLLMFSDEELVGKIDDLPNQESDDDETRRMLELMNQKKNKIAKKSKN